MITKLLVFVQFATLLIIVLVSNPSIFSNPVSLLIFCLALILGIIPIVQKNFKVNVFPETTKEMKLIKVGIYKYIRHPMYLSVLLVGFSFIIADPKAITLLFWMILLIDLHIKMDFEEVDLMRSFPEYVDYRKSTKRLIPIIY